MAVIMACRHSSVLDCLPACWHMKAIAHILLRTCQQLFRQPQMTLGLCCQLQVDATVHRISAAKHEVTGYPALKWFHSGKAQPYSGGRQS